ncbi:MAG: ABC transporter permease [Acidobacteria bacterium]|nr:ABC transporter permease [Acidobacteriota bacterium]
MRVFNTDLGENFRMAIVTLWQNKLRSFLTILGVVIGTITTIVIAAFVSGIDARVSKEIEAFGSNSIYAFKFDPGFNINPSMEERTRKPLKEEDADAIRAECSNCEFVSPFMSPVDFTVGPFTERVNIRNKEIEMTNAAVMGAHADYFKMGVSHLAEGRYFTADEEARRGRVAVIGIDVANTLFPFTNALDQDIPDRRAQLSHHRYLAGARTLSRRRRRPEQREQDGLYSIQNDQTTLSGERRLLHHRDREARKDEGSARGNAFDTASGPKSAGR